MAEAKRNISESEKLWDDLWDAHRAWELAWQQFNHTVDPDIIDDAIYLLRAAEMRYEGLLRIARRRKLNIDLNGRITAADFYADQPERRRIAVSQEPPHDAPTR